MKALVNSENIKFNGYSNPYSADISLRPKDPIVPMNPNLYKPVPAQDNKPLPNQTQSSQNQPTKNS